MLAMLGIDDWRFLRPVKFGDTIHVRMTIVEARERSKPDRGILRRSVEVLNQRGESVQEGHITSLCLRRPTSPPGAPTPRRAEDQ